MDNTFDIMFDDLNPAAQKAFLEFMGMESAKEGNFDVFPIAVIGDSECDCDDCECDDECDCSEF